MTSLEWAPGGAPGPSRPQTPLGPGGSDDPGRSFDPRGEVRRAALHIRDALTRLGCCYETRAGELIEISYRQLGLVGARYALLEVDVQRLPPRVRIDRLSQPETLHHLTAVVGKPVHVLNTTGLTYCVELQRGATRRLPRRAPLEIEARPQGPYMIPIGQGPDGAAWRSLLETSHILVGGESRSGKSTWLNAMLVALLTTHTPGELQLALVDPKGVEFTPYEGIPHLIRPVALTPSAASAVTSALVTEMDRRRDLFAGVYARNLAAYNERARRAGEDALPLNPPFAELCALIDHDGRLLHRVRWWTAVPVTQRGIPVPMTCRRPTPRPIPAISPPAGRPEHPPLRGHGAQPV